ncbi:baseplate wedge subunit [Agrobacterium phage Atu_ph07]|uniref:Uncharacterized protein n=1 Tax=Agrobacterium phage Atu_ph07 TaxID=2024264 RepID=A0A223W0C8_9CAUD|nr:baseplate wedge subunit [Agrobacterium phage Atu_ph07]ASV44766.1 hypothetical protein [Agrobacterium phage Atu_ph07]
MTEVKYRSGSPYAATPQTSWYLENLVLRQIDRAPSDKKITLHPKYENRPYNLSYDLYGTRDFWWVFMVLNIDIIRDPIYDFKAGIEIYVPTRERVLGNTGQARN